MTQPPSEIVAALRAAGCVFAEDEALLLVEAAATPAQLTTLVARRTGGEPLEQVLGWAEFCGLRISVEPGVFVPRRRSELLVREAGGVAPPGAVVVELCCGSGAVGAALAARIDGCELHVADVDPVAVRCARRNVAAVGGRAYEGDLDAPLPAGLRGRVDVVVANAPYVPTGEVPLMPPEARLHEPRTALDGGADGLDVVRRVVVAAPRWLAPGGHVLIESSERQAPDVVRAMERAGLRARVAACEDLAATAVVGSLRACW